MIMNDIDNGRAVLCNNMMLAMCVFIQFVKDLYCWEI